MLEKLDKIQELLKIPNVDKNPELAIANMKILNLLVSLRSDIEQLNLCGVSNRRELLIATFKDLDLEYIQGFDDEEWLANKVIEVINCC